MFDSYYNFSDLGKTTNPLQDGSWNTLRTFKFRAKYNIYLIHVKCYENSLYVLEFFLHKDLNSKKDQKYGRLTGDFEASRIIRTSFEIILTILHHDPYASFAFIGSPTVVGEQEVETINQTQRFRIYRFVSINLLGKESFDQFSDTKTSCYLIVNRKMPQAEIRNKANTILKSHFE